MEQNCGKGFFSSLLTLATVSAGAYLCCRMARNLVAFCKTFDAPAQRAEPTFGDEIEERADACALS